MTEPLAERRRRLLRDEIAHIALNLFADNGFDSVTVADIASAAGISERTFFRYFLSKDEVVLDYERQVHHRLVAAVANRPPTEGPVTALRKAYLQTSHVEPGMRPRVAQLGRILAEAPALRARSHGERLGQDDPLMLEVQRRFRRPDDSVYARIIVTAMDAVAANEFRSWALSGATDDPGDRIDLALRVLVDGLRSLD